MDKAAIGVRRNLRHFVHTVDVIRVNGVTSYIDS